MRRTSLALLLTALGSLALAASAAQAAPAEYAGSSASGTKVFFTTTAKLVPGDTDNGFRDVYERLEDTVKGVETYVTREVSTGPTGGNDSYDVAFDGVSTEGTKVFFSTAESLVAEDEDRSTDIYMRNTSTGATTLVSQGAAACAPACGNDAFPVTFVGVTSSGSRAFFMTSEKLAEGDGDEGRDVYVRDLGLSPATALVSRPDPICSGCTANAPVTLPVIEGKPAISEGGTKVVFESTDKLATGDTDGENDIYERDLTSGKTALVSVAGTCTVVPTSECAPLYRGLSADGTRVFTQTRAQLAPGDEDNRQDVYEWSVAIEPPTLVSVSGDAEKGNGNFDAVFAGSSSDGSVVLFETAEKLSVEDADTVFDVYERVGGETKLVSAGTAHTAVFNRVSTDGGAFLFSTVDPLGGGDTGEMQDVYAWEGATPTLVSAGSSAFAGSFAGASQDASKVFYATAAKLSGADKDEKSDIYAGPGTPDLVSTGTVADKGLDTPHLAGVSASGDHAFFTTTERLTVDDDFSGEQDVYDRSATGTLLVSVANPGELELGPPAPGLTGTNPGSPGVSTEPAVLGEAEPGSAIKLYATPDCSGAPVGIGTAAEAGDPAPGSFEITVTVADGSTTTFHATAINGLGDGSGCSTSTVTYRQESIVPPPPPPSEEGAGGGSGGGGSTGGSGGSTGGTGGSTSGSTGGSGSAIKIGGVVYVAPITRITYGPASKTRSRRPVFRFVDATEQPGTAFLCRVDRRAWKGCSSPFKLPGLKPGPHTFAVKGRSFADQWEQQPVIRKFKVAR
jgi:hypothetical protein